MERYCKAGQDRPREEETTVGQVQGRLGIGKVKGRNVGQGVKKGG